MRLLSYEVVGCDIVGRLCRILFFKQKTAYEMRISDWSSDVCSADRPVEIDRVPVGNRRNQQVQPRCATFLIFQRAIGEPTLPVGIDGGGKRVPRLAFVETGLTGTASFRLFTPLQRDQRALCPGNFRQGKLRSTACRERRCQNVEIA